MDLKRRHVLGAMAGTAIMIAIPGARAEEKMYVAVICKAFLNQFWQAVRAGVEKAAAEYGVETTFEGTDNETQVDRQMDIFAAALAKHPTAIGFAALDSQAAVPLLQQAKDQGVPIIAFDSGVESDIPVTTCATDNLAAAAMAADKMAALIGNEGKVAVVVHNQTSKTGVDRRDGFVNRIKEAYPKIEVIAVEYSDNDQLKATEITKAILQANPDVKGLFGANEGSALGVIAGAQELGSKVVVVGYDSGAGQKDAIRKGLMAGAVTQNPVGIGYETVKAAIMAAKGESVPKTIDTGFFWYDKTNIDDPKIAAVLYD